ncbi:hypothetical protein [Neomegalonema sp.]|uniref:hypothetical protein n=1 Tax=Neomegalonema sp. TaxID=2039713 RepID=UPI002631FF39|nr:hypothetical protein [Neomegalonema sp.]MDD2870141.1 hypothetical protein [Neomegalonema sp.]
MTGIPLEDLIEAYPDPLQREAPALLAPLAPEAEPEPEPPGLDLGERLTLTHEGVTYAAMTAARLLAAGVPETAISAVRLEQAKAAARAALAEHVAAARASLITILPGQEMIYLAKEAEALDWVSAPSPDLADHPLLSAEVGVTAETADQLAQLWMNMGALWRAAAAQLEALRLTVGAAIAAAQTIEEVQNACEALQ